MTKNITPFISPKQILESVQKTAGQIHSNYKKEKEAPILLIILEGARIFACKLFEEWCRLNSYKNPFFITSCKSTSYKKNKKIQQPVLEFSNPYPSCFLNKNIIIVDDIAETGHTLQAVKKEVLKFNPKSIEMCVMISRKNNREVPLDLDYVGIEITDPGFLVGVGLDYDGKYRNLPYIGVWNEKN